MLYASWKKETDILGKFGSYEETFLAKHDEVKEKIVEYVINFGISWRIGVRSLWKLNSSFISIQKWYANPSASWINFYELDHKSSLHQVDISPLLGIAAVPDDVDLIHNNMIDEKYYELLDQLNMKEEEFYTCNALTLFKVQKKFCVHYGAGKAN